MAIPELDYTEAPHNGYILLITTYAKIQYAKIKCSIPKQQWIAPEKAHEHFICPEGYKAFRGAKVNMGKQNVDGECASERRLRAFDFLEAWVQILINLRSWYWVAYFMFKTEIKEIEEYFEHVSKLLKGYCGEDFYSLIALVVLFLFQDKERIRINNFGILKQPSLKLLVEEKQDICYDSSKPNGKWTFHFNHEFVWSKHVGGYIELSPDKEALDPNYDHRAALAFLGAKFVILFDNVLILF